MFGSGFCALAYQTAWMRMFRLLFGATTAASASTVALFMGGLGLGGWLLGRRVEKHPRPLALYGLLELGVAALALASLALMPAATAAYHATGGSGALGMFGATVVRLLLAAVVMGPAALLMGATLPAAARVVTTDEDTGRTGVAVLLGVNTLGAVAGAALTTFVMLEHAGTRATLLWAVALNAVVGLSAWLWGRRITTMANAPELPARGASGSPETARAMPSAAVLVAAGFVGFAFMLMEVVWYRMLAPILGGSTYTFGTVLATALLGLGLGGAAYALVGRRRAATATGLAALCASEALLLVVPMALGDRVALLAAFLRPVSVLGFGWLVTSWCLVAAVVVLPAALVAGYQFPYLVALAGRGRTQVGRDVGLVYAANTLGAILGSLSGGFFLMPLLGAVGAWRAAGALLGLVSLALLAWAIRGRGERFRFASMGALAIVLALWPCLRAEGPTAVWRHSGIGAGRATVTQARSFNQVKEWMDANRRTTPWEVDGRESSIALADHNGVSVVVNGKSDGNAIADAATTILLGLLGPLTVGEPKSALVVGLGTGMTAGWVGTVPSVERVDVAEIEPSTVEVARAAHEVNEGVLSNPKVRLRHEDAREILLSSHERFDLIVSEPSNPYRAGVADLFTREFFEAAHSHLSEEGAFVQWLQAYEVDPETLSTVLATLGDVFPQVDVWIAADGDFLLRGLVRPAVREAGLLRQRLAQESMARGVRIAWTTDTLEGVLAHFVADDGLVRALVPKSGRALNTDDVNRLEFGFARTVGNTSWDTLNALRDAAIRSGTDRPSWVRGDVDWSLVARERAAIGLKDREGTLDGVTLERAHRLKRPMPAQVVAAEWRRTPYEPAGLRERLVLARALAEVGDPAAPSMADALQRAFPAEALVMRAEWQFSQGEVGASVNTLLEAIAAWRRQGWLAKEARIADLAFPLVASIGPAQLTAATQFFEAVAAPFPAKAEEQFRGELRLRLAAVLGTPESCRAAFGALEPHVPWVGAFLERRQACYESTHDPREATAREDLSRFLREESPALTLRSERESGQ